MNITVEIEGGMKFSFVDFISAKSVDIQGKPDKARLKYDGSPMVDIIAESSQQLCFIEAKNFVRFSNNELIQSAMNQAKAESYSEIADVQAFARKMINKLEHSLFVWIASGNTISKPVSYILAFNVDQQFDNNIRRILIERLNKFIPKTSCNPLKRETDAITKIYFDMPDTYESYGFEVVTQSSD
jgi:hypothetical protein